MARVNIFMDLELLQDTDREARESGISRSVIVQEALRSYLEARRQARAEEESRRRRHEASERIDQVAERLGQWDSSRAIREGRERRSPAKR